MLLPIAVAALALALLLALAAAEVVPYRRLVLAPNPPPNADPSQTPPPFPNGWFAIANSADVPLGRSVEAAAFSKYPPPPPRSR
jgi:hypothetical protein